MVEAGRKEFTQIGGLQFSSIVPHIPNATEVKGICQIMEPTWTGYWKWFDGLRQLELSPVMKWNSSGIVLAMIKMSGSV